VACLVAYAVADARKIFQIFARQPFSARPFPHAALILQYILTKSDPPAKPVVLHLRL